MEQPTQEVCSNCNQQLEGIYCHHCGQKNTNSKTTWVTVLNAFAAGFFSLERGALHSFLAMMLNPAKVVRLYWKGGRYYYFTPGQMIFFTLFILAVHLSLINSSGLLGGFLFLKVEGFGDSNPFFNIQFFFFISILPLISIASYITFWKERYSLPQHIISTTYILSFWLSFITILDDIVYLITQWQLQAFFFLFMLGIWIWKYLVFHSGKVVWYKLILYVLIQFIIYVCLLALILLVLYLLLAPTDSIEIL
jgi:hypothetical protein